MNRVKMVELMFLLYKLQLHGREFHNSGSFEIRIETLSSNSFSNRQRMYCKTCHKTIIKDFREYKGEQT